jgi:hypothetical protein
MPAFSEYPRPIRTVANLSSAIRQAPGTRLLFRGQNVDKPLLPRIARNTQVPYDRLNEAEQAMLSRFQKESLPFLSGLKPANDWEWLSLAQHQGLPTRLLDWTGNALAGLWFAVHNPSPSDFGVLWILSVDPATQKTPTKTNPVFSATRTFLFQPFHIDRRIAAQAGWFSAHKYVEAKSKFIGLETNTRFSHHLTRCLIPADRFKPLLKELRSMGVTEATLFPGLPGLCGEVSAELFDPLNEEFHGG